MSLENTLTIMNLENIITLHLANQSINRDLSSFVTVSLVRNEVHHFIFAYLLLTGRFSIVDDDYFRRLSPLQLKKNKSLKLLLRIPEYIQRLKS